MLNMWCFVLLALYTIIARGIIILSPSRIKLACIAFDCRHVRLATLLFSIFSYVSQNKINTDTSSCWDHLGGHILLQVFQPTYFLAFYPLQSLEMHLNTFCAIIRYFRSMLSLIDTHVFLVFVMAPKPDIHDYRTYFSVSCITIYSRFSI